MRRLTSDELKLVMERGTAAFGEWTASEVVEALALEVSERRAAEAEGKAEKLIALAERLEGRP